MAEYIKTFIGVGTLYSAHLSIIPHVCSTGKVLKIVLQQPGFRFLIYYIV